MMQLLQGRVYVQCVLLLLLLLLLLWLLRLTKHAHNNQSSFLVRLNSGKQLPREPQVSMIVCLLIRTPQARGRRPIKPRTVGHNKVW